MSWRSRSLIGYNRIGHLVIGAVLVKSRIGRPRVAHQRRVALFSRDGVRGILVVIAKGLYLMVFDVNDSFHTLLSMSQANGCSLYHATIAVQLLHI